MVELTALPARTGSIALHQYPLATSGSGLTLSTSTLVLIGLVAVCILVGAYFMFHTTSNG